MLKFSISYFCCCWEQNIWPEVTWRGKGLLCLLVQGEVFSRGKVWRSMRQLVPPCLRSGAERCIWVLSSLSLSRSEIQPEGQHNTQLGLVFHLEWPFLKRRTQTQRCFHSDSKSSQVDAELAGRKLEHISCVIWVSANLLICKAVVILVLSFRDANLSV